MKKQYLIGGLVVVAAAAGTTGVAIAHAAGAGGAAPAASATASPTGGPSGTATAGTKAGKAGKGAKGAGADGTAASEILGKLKDFQHAEWVTKDATNASVTHEAILGTVKDVSATSITVTSADGTSMTFAVDAKTVVREPHAKGAKATKAGKAGGTATGTPSATATTSATAAPKPTIADVKAGQTVLVGGAKSPDLTAANVLVRAG